MTAIHNGAMKPIVVALEIEDEALSQRLIAALAAAPDIRVAERGEAADVALVLPEAAQRDEATDSTLTQRELEVLALVAEGASNKLIARRLGISVHTAKFHVGSLIDKLDATGRAAAVAQAARLGVLHL
ncbi:response regulator transcription factor [Variovorax sp. RA8]|uniref:response regulator transcription factor n=1 Tax=Variovorax sp. (strain JCM 16519 / RA8) TaxID=662548 RepID=UPI001E5423B2|nr:LuxR C-terminal-related transcriptional regulator [Variovorax sp. RA8]